MDTITEYVTDEKGRDWKIQYVEIEGIKRGLFPRDPPDVEILEIQVKIKGTWHDIPMHVASKYIDLIDATL